MLSIVELVKLNILSSAVTLARYMGGGWGGGGGGGRGGGVYYHIMLGEYHLLSPVQ